MRSQRWQTLQKRSTFCGQRDECYNTCASSIQGKRKMPVLKRPAVENEGVATAGDVVAKGEDTMAFRHGPVSAVNARALSCFFLSAREHTRRYELDVLKQYQEALDKTLYSRTVQGVELHAYESGRTFS